MQTAMPMPARHAYPRHTDGTTARCNNNDSRATDASAEKKNRLYSALEWTLQKRGAAAAGAQGGEMAARLLERRISPARRPGPRGEKDLRPEGRGDWSKSRGASTGEFPDK